MPCDCDAKPHHESIRSVVERRAAQYVGAPFLLAARDERQITYGELQERVSVWRHVIRSHGVEPGSRVGLMIGDPIDFAVAFIAVMVDGSWVAPLDPTVAVVRDEQLVQRISNLHLDVIVSDRAAPAHVTVAWIVASEAEVGRDPAEAPDRATDDEGGLILSSSGTTGTPKVIALASQQLVHAAQHIAAHNGLSDSERGFNPLPLWHVNAEVVGLLATLVAGASLVLDDRFHRTDFWSLIDRLEVTWINAVPAIVSRIAVVNPGESVPSRLRFVRSASAPLSPALLEAFEANTGVTIIESYGMTEAASQICVNPLDGTRKIGSVGPPVGVELRVVPIEDAPAHGVGDDAAVVGHVEIRGPSVISHYDAAGYEDRFDADGWLKTGDLGYLDDDGYLFLVGRSDDVINRGGEKIFPREIEDVVLAVPDVVAAAVFGVPDEVFGQVPVLYVQFTPGVLTDGVTLDEHVSGLGQLLNVSFVRARRPVRVVVVASFPAHATGKIQKKSLAADAGAVLLERELK